LNLYLGFIIKNKIKRGNNLNAEGVKHISESIIKLNDLKYLNLDLMYLFKKKQKVKLYAS
jgi:hypothetical protein